MLNVKSVLTRAIVALAVALALVLPVAAYGSNCITVNGKTYCEQTQEISVGGVKLKVTDPAALLHAAKKSKGGLKKTGLYDDYNHIPVILELAKQNDMDYNQFVTHMILRWESEAPNPFATVRSMEIIYDEINPMYRHTFVEGIAWQIADDVESAILEVWRY